MKMDGMGLYPVMTVMGVAAGYTTGRIIAGGGRFGSALF